MSVGLLITLGAWAGLMSEAVPADLLVENAQIYTMGELDAVVEAMAIRDGRIVALGTTEQLEAFRGPATERFDARGRAILPGFVDAHAHLLGLGRSLLQADLVGTGSFAEVVERAQAHASAEADKHGWLLGRGWDQNDWPVTKLPRHAALSRAFPDRPVALSRIDGHALLLNAFALRLAGITKATPDPEGGRLLRHPESGEPTGVLLDNAMDLVRGLIPDPSLEAEEEGVRRAVALLHRYGVTSVHDAGLAWESVERLASFAAADTLKLRVSVMLDGHDGRLPTWLEAGPRLDLGGTGRLQVRGVKFYLDGALGSRGAALLEPYSDSTDTNGLLLAKPEDLERLALLCLQSGFQLSTHAIGDRANRLALDAYAAAFQAAAGLEEPIDGTQARFRIEHAQVIHPDDVPRFATLGVIAAMQAVHQTSDAYWVEERLGPDRSRSAYAWRAILDAGARLAGGSDFPVESPNPFLSLHAAVNRRDADGWPDGGWHPEQRLNRKEAVASVTDWAAWAGFQEGELGSLEPGCRADFVLLSADPFLCPSMELHAIEVEATAFGGEFVYRRQG